LGKCWIIAEKIDVSLERKNRYPYSALAEITYGRSLSNFVSFLVDMTIFCGGIPNLIVGEASLSLVSPSLTSGCSFPKSATARIET
jgi:vesicular inhibitory amino acid transporter